MHVHIYMCVCVCIYVYVCVYVCVRMCMYVCGGRIPRHVKAQFTHWFFETSCFTNNNILLALLPHALTTIHVFLHILHIVNTCLFGMDTHIEIQGLVPKILSFSDDDNDHILQSSMISQDDKLEQPGRFFPLSKPLKPTNLEDKKPTTPSSH